MKYVIDQYASHEPGFAKELFNAWQPVYEVIDNCEEEVIQANLTFFLAPAFNAMQRNLEMLFEKNKDYAADRYTSLMNRIAKAIMIYVFRSDIINSEPLPFNPASLGKQVLSDFIYQNDEVTKEDFIKDFDFLNEEEKRHENKPGQEYYYWPHSISALTKLYDLLIYEKIIGQTMAFEQSFLKENDPKRQKTNWLISQTSCFALLYLLFDRQPTYRNEPIPQIATKLFNFPNVKANQKSTNESFRTFSMRITHSDYLLKKHQNIVELLDKLNLKR